MDWYPHPGPQMEFCSRGEFEVLFGGAKGPGKTDCLIMEAGRDIEHPRYHGLLLRRTFPRLQEIIDRCWLWYPSFGGDYRAGEHRWYFPSGSKITLGHVQHEDDKRNWHGKEIHFLGFDEITEFTYTQYTFICANVRMAQEGLGLRIRCTTNPGGIGHVWVKEYFVDPCKPEEEIDYLSGDGNIRTMFVVKPYIDPVTQTSRSFVPATVYDNPSIMINDPGYVRRLEGLQGVERLRLLHGDWRVFEGQVFDELNDRVHGCDDFPIPPEWERIMVFDWGYARPYCALWFAVDFDGTIYLYRELYGMKEGDPNKGMRYTNTQICREIFKAEDDTVKFRVADPACWSPTKIKGSNVVHGPSFVEDAANEGLFFLKGDNDRLFGKQQIHQRLMVDVEVDSAGEITDEKPRFVAFRSCKRWWTEMLDLREDPKNPEDVDSSQPDEGYDCTRYAFMSRPIIPKKIVTIPPGSFQAERKRYIRAKEHAKRHGVSLSAAYARVR